MSEHAPDAGRPLARILPTLLEAIARGALLVRVSDARVLDANAAFARLVRREREDVIGRSAVELGLWDGPEVLEQLAAEFGTEMETVVLSPDGAANGEAGVEAVGQVVTLDGDTAIAFLTLDPSDHSSLQRTLRAAQERFEQAFSEAPIGMALGTVDPDDPGRYVRVNRAFCELTGYSEDELIGRRFADITHADDVAGQLEARARLVAGEVSDYETEKRYIRADGTPVWARTHVTLIRDADGRPLQAVLMAIDINDQKIAQRLEARLAQSQRLETVGQLAGGVAHDFNNLLAVIINYAHFVHEQLPEGSGLRGDVDEIRNAAERASDLTHQLLVFSRQEAIQPEVLDLNAVVCDMERLLRRTIGDHVKLVTDISSEPCMVSADATQLEQVVMNLVVNARDAMPEGGTICVETRRVELAEERNGAPGSLRPGRYAVLSVWDEGVGMEPGVVARAFEPFFTTKPKGTGTGLGLATAYGTITASGGEAEIESAPGLGTTVRVWLPEETRPAKQGGRFTPARTHPDHPPATVLVVEDEDAVRRLTCRILEGGGYRCLQASSGDHALDLVARGDETIDVLVTDVVMPGMSGKELAERLGGDSGLPVLFISGYTDDTMPSRDQPGHGQVLLHKPFTKDDLLRYIDDALAGTRGVAPH